MKNSRIIELEAGLRACGKLKGVKFAVHIAKAMKVIQPILESNYKGIEPSEAFMEYDQKRVELATKHAKKDAENNAKLRDGNFVLADTAAFEAELEELRKEYKEALDYREKQEKDYKEFLKEDTPLVFVAFPSEDLPEDITGDQVAGIYETIQF